jgi:hypothetical protein
VVAEKTRREGKIALSGRRVSAVWRAGAAARGAFESALRGEQGSAAGGVPGGAAAEKTRKRHSSLGQARTLGQAGPRGKSSPQAGSPGQATRAAG